MLEKVFWEIFENTGSINAYVASKDFEPNNEHKESTYNDYNHENNKTDGYYNNEMT